MEDKEELQPDEHGNIELPWLLDIYNAYLDGYASIGLSLCMKNIRTGNFIVLKIAYCLGIAHRKNVQLPISEKILIGFLNKNYDLHIEEEK